MSGCASGEWCERLYRSNLALQPLNLALLLRLFAPEGEHLACCRLVSVEQLGERAYSQLAKHLLHAAAQRAIEVTTEEREEWDQGESCPQCCSTECYRSNSIGEGGEGARRNISSTLQQGRLACSSRESAIEATAEQREASEPGETDSTAHASARGWRWGELLGAGG